MVSYTDPTDGTPVQDTQPSASDGKQWVDTSQSPPELKIYDSATQAWLPADTTSTIVSQTKPTPEVGKVWFEPVSGGSNMYAASSNRWEFVKFLSAIPAPAVYRWPHDEGSGTTLGDSDPDGDGNTVNGTISNPTWVSDNTAQGGTKLSFDDTASAEYVDFATVSEVGTSSDFAVGITVELDTTSDTGYIWGHASSQSNTVVCGLSNQTLSGEITALQYDGSFKNARTLGTTETTTNRMRLLINFSLADANNQSISIYKNASDIDSSASGNANEFVGGSGHRVGSTFSDSSAERLGGDTDDLIIYNDTLSSSEIQTDYDIQPWS